MSEVCWASVGESMGSGSLQYLTSGVWHLRIGCFESDFGILNIGVYGFIS